ncbi:1,4-dihydroxy-2-naphthoate polyprenyltransferase [Vibrio sp. HA2012]|uniref:1,4-dihydroxy-2-naphthoate polyprenyltransferase n=1 Tax=Vibrio sp. HA2012 TaxID=1971595 RepID=UPI000C2C7E3F|nr:1,4-dihydroxy-2-naphthoate polyprenyltransferase [Vibrio sp. HA2012]PJC85649.1 1,4-dihydroxy-2-naphthoate polyprenyltransferase [Vibrio sp. HA2012]
MNKSVSIWLEAFRPKTLPLALVSIITGSALAHANGHFSLIIMLLALITATLLQILSNLANDYGDAQKGTDNEHRLGPVRAMQQGVTSQEMRTAIIINITVTLVSGLALVLYSLDSLTNILTFLSLGALAVIAAIAYTVGQKPYGYLGLGDLSVFIFFGLLGVAGTFFLHTGYLDISVFIPATASGLLAAGVLNINNMRDIDNDRACGKHTFAVRLGELRAKHYHLILIWTAFTIFAAYLLYMAGFWLLLPFIPAAAVIARHGHAVLHTTAPVQIAPMLPVIVKCAVITNILFSLIVISQTLTR